MRTLQEILSILDNTIPSPKIPLFFKDPYTLLIATLLSAQCTDETVNKVTPILFSKADTPQKMVLLDLLEIEKIIRPCGLFHVKAKHIIELSLALIERWGGEMPSSLELLKTLPGVGHKTASVVAVGAFGLPAFPVDTHIIRSAQRWGLSKEKTPHGVEKDLKALIPKELWGKVHLQMILFARKYCKAKAHIPANCPICCPKEPKVS